jgi:hypothetical protein
LRDVSNATAVPKEKPDVSPVRHAAHNASDQRCFAGTIGTNQRVDGPRLHVYIDIF